MEKDTQILRRGTTSAMIWTVVYAVWAVTYGLYMALIPSGVLFGTGRWLVMLLLWAPQVLVVIIIGLGFAFRQQVTLAGLLALLPLLISAVHRTLIPLLSVPRLMGIISGATTILGGLIVLAALLIIALQLQPHREWALVMVGVGFVLVLLQVAGPMAINPLMTALTRRTNIVELIAAANYALSMVIALGLTGTFAALAWAGLSD